MKIYVLEKTGELLLGNMGGVLFAEGGERKKEAGDADKCGH